jgi:PhnB protein
MELNSYLTFNGTCEAALRFYEKALGGKVIALHRFGGSPMGGSMPPELNDKIMHGRMTIGNQVLMGSDATPMHPYQGIEGCSMSLNVDTPSEGERLFDALAEKGTVKMPFQKTFWALGFGMLVDQFGVPWMVNCEEKTAK